MFVSADIEKVRKRIALAKTKANKVGFVPTMGAIHAGHISLIKRSKVECNKTIVSIFVNKPQFNKKKDYKTSQPISQAPSHQPSQADQLNQTRNANLNTQVMNNTLSQPSHNFNNAFAGPTTPLVDASNPVEDQFVPLAANDGMGSLFGSKF